MELAQKGGRELSSIGELKQLFIQAVARVEADLRHQGIEADVGLLADQRFGQDSLNAATGRGWWVARPVEVQGSRPLAFEHGRSIGSNLIAWPQEQIIKCLVQFHPDDEPLLRLEQEAQLMGLYKASQASGHELLLEIIPPKDHPSPHRTCSIVPSNASTTWVSSGVVEDRGPGRAGVAAARRADPTARPVLPWRGPAGPQRPGRRVGRRLSPGPSEHHLPWVRRGPHDLPGTEPGLAGRGNRRRNADPGCAGQVCGIDRGVACCAQLKEFKDCKH